VTHDQEEALALSDRIAIMEKGRILQLGTPDDVYERPTSTFVASFLGESNLIRVEVVSMNGRMATVRSIKDQSLCFTGALAQGAAGAKDLVAMIRPEAFTTVAHAGGGNTVSGTVRVREFLGPTVRLTVGCHAGDITVRMPRSELAKAMDQGSSVDLLWKSEDTLLFPCVKSCGNHP
jgi:ABC-type Fe3+/spermidine/putrescine transport system ATPase subunit